MLPVENQQIKKFHGQQKVSRGKNSKLPYIPKQKILILVLLHQNHFGGEGGGGTAFLTFHKDLASRNESFKTFF